jgi:hypothetical protein
MFVEQDLFLQLQKTAGMSDDAHPRFSHDSGEHFRG